MIQKEFLTVSQLNALMKDVINVGFPYPLWVCGEIQGFDRNKDKKHIFFDLCEKDPVTKDIVASIGLVIFHGKKIYIEEILRTAENAFAIKDDIEVKFLCKVDFYPPHGSMRLVVESIDPVHTLGKIAQQRQKIIALLRQEGLLDKNKTVLLPEVLLKIGLITAFDSAAYHDFIGELQKSKLGFKVYCINTLMQGKKAEGDVCLALDIFNRREDIDVVVITRGGGSIAELSCFDSEKIARKIAALSLPVLSGIGHEINTTVTDLAAHTYEKTPTAIARFLVHRVENFLALMNEKMDEVIAQAREKFAYENNQLRDSALKLENEITDFLKSHHRDLMHMTAVIRLQPFQSLNTSHHKLLVQSELFSKVIRKNFKDVQTRLDSYERIVEMAHPVNTLKRGFTLTRTHEGKIVKSIEQINLNEIIATQFSDGISHSRVQNLKKGGKGE